jgi:hypothetical protein
MHVSLVAGALQLTVQSVHPHPAWQLLLHELETVVESMTPSVSYSTSFFALQ